MNGSIIWQARKASAVRSLTATLLKMPIGRLRTVTIGCACRTPPSSKDMIWVEVPDEAVITEPNKAGRTMVWRVYGPESVSIRCFMPGSMI